MYGRKPPLFVGYAIFAIFQVPVAVAQNVETIMLGRFFAGLFASAPLAVVGLVGIHNAKLTDANAGWI